MSVRARPRFHLLSASLGLLLACLPAAAPAAPPTLTVSAAANLSFALEEGARSFQRGTGIRVLLNFGTTGQLAQQIEQGAPVDLFVAADTETVMELERLGLLLAGTRRVYARGRLALYSPADFPSRPERLEDLVHAEFKRIALPNPERSPYGAAAREALQAVGLWEALQPRLILAENVRQALMYAETGNVEAALVAASLKRPGDTGHWVLVPEQLHHPLDQALAIVRGTRHEPEARRLAAFLLGPDGRAILSAYGYQLPPASQAPLEESSP
jgi:molybdate transport system substrate-binding protein